jgi:hypothetical protein
MMNTDTLVITIVLVVLFCLAVVLKGLKPHSKKNNHGSYSAKILLNKSELKVLKILDEAVPSIFGADARVFGQVSYGEFIKGDDPSSQARINQKRADFVIINHLAKVICVIEYQGAGHFGRGPKARANAEHRDRVKRAACVGAGYQFVEIPAKFTIHDVRVALEKASNLNPAITNNS